MTIELIDPTDGGVLEVNVSRHATDDELREQGRRLAAAYKPGPRQATPFMPSEQPADLSLWIYLPSTRRWECHQNGSLEIRDYLRAIWRAAGCATAVVL